MTFTSRAYKILGLKGFLTIWKALLMAFWHAVFLLYTEPVLIPLPFVGDHFFLWFHFLIFFLKYLLHDCTDPLKIFSHFLPLFTFGKISSIPLSKFSQQLVFHNHLKFLRARSYSLFKDTILFLFYDVVIFEPPYLYLEVLENLFREHPVGFFLSSFIPRLAGTSLFCVRATINFLLFSSTYPFNLQPYCQF